MESPMTGRSIVEWIHSAVLEGGHSKFDDLHVDEIDARYQDPISWVPASLDALNEASRIRDENGWRFTIALAIPLAPSKQSGDSKPQVIQDLIESLGDTPPSLYAFERGMEPWAQGPDEFQRLSGLTTHDREAVAYLSERFDAEEGEHNRNVWIAR